MDLISGKWLLMLGVAAAWSTVFSMFNTPGVRSLRNLGLLSCYALGLLMAFVLPWRVSLATWGLAGVATGLLYVFQELVGYLRTPDRSQAARPGLVAIVHALIVWPIMFPEAIEYLLAELGVLKAPPEPPAPQVDENP